MTEKKGFIARVVGKFAAEKDPESHAKEDSCCTGTSEESVAAAKPVVVEVESESSCCGGCGGTGH